MNQTPELLFKNNVIDKYPTSDLIQELNEVINMNSDICDELIESLENMKLIN
ncbi:MAG: hypothetical protein HFH45_04360 [Bacilli bacterium]|nr:hypothetical protein [Bacilli bacterium]